jgi:integrase
MLAYGAGLRVSEIAALQVGDVDGGRMLIRVPEGKTGQRYVMMGARVLATLRDYWRAQRP